MTVSPHSPNPCRLHGGKSDATAGGVRRSMLDASTKDDNAPWRRIFPALRVALRRMTAGVAVLGKAASLSVGPRLDGSSPRNAMQTVGV